MQKKEEIIKKDKIKQNVLNDNQFFLEILFINFN